MGPQSQRSRTLPPVAPATRQGVCRRCFQPCQVSQVQRLPKSPPHSTVAPTSRLARKPQAVTAGGDSLRWCCPIRQGVSEAPILQIHCGGKHSPQFCQRREYPYNLFSLCKGIFAVRTLSEREGFLFHPFPQVRQRYHIRIWVQ